MTTKTEKAIAIYKKHYKKLSNSEIVQKLIKMLPMTEAGARTYAFNARKALGLGKSRNTRRKLATTATAGSRSRVTKRKYTKRGVRQLENS